ncbi:MAG TPA: single-stranded-DNA-specific exonuclease RecJ [Thermoflexales bacterium]|nr:single-stranded-DNA-specific exonuclease RecJ [Thermoflexales bacterium]HQZ23633.1 single-stranded-DNA-specific exonuclease RecJ [Thermoflexales bacterium]
MSYEWHIAGNAPAEFFRAAAPLHPLVAQVMFARGITLPADALAFVNGDGETLHDPFLLKDMRRAVERILAAIANGEKIAIYGDYDCDGVTACALMQTTLKALGAHGEVYIPDRFEEGYGLNSAALTKLKGDGCSLVVTVDCGARAMPEAEHARQIGLDLIVTDHHELEPGLLPDALAVVNPNRPDCSYPFKKLAGVGVAYKLALALLSAKGETAFNPSSLLDLVAVGTVADVVALTGENRALVKDGLERLNAFPRLGLRALMNAAKVKNPITAQTIGFTLGPRLNAAGRLDTAKTAYELLIAEQDEWAHELAQALNDRNASRQLETAKVAKDAEARAMEGQNAADVALVFAAAQEYNAGVIGLAASRLLDKFHAPAVVVTIDPHRNEARGSCRSLSGFHITEALDECKPLLLKHGGHAAAAGFTLRPENVGVLAAQLREIAAMQRPAGGWARALQVDALITRDDVLGKAYAALQSLEPHGEANPRPTFAVQGARVLTARRVGKGDENTAGQHLQMTLKLTHSNWSAIAFRKGERINEIPPGAKLDVAFQLDMNEFNGEKKLQLQVIDFKVN